MITSLSGRLRVRESGRVVLQTGGIGYEVFIPLSTYYRLPSAGDETELEIRQVIREDSITLYGFATLAEKRAFDLLMGVQHVGPKLALAVLSVLAPDELASAISDGDVERIDAVPGVGARVAERIVRELRNKIAELNFTEAAPRPSVNGSGRSPANAMLDDAVSALVNLGYKPAEAKRAVEVAGEEGGLEAILRRSLAVILGEK
ncbi:MAG TPA: Holliday junction branch migration protein RuvA [Candidatus Binataceae bacterium]|jgi:Holliday junction DNA helicase RuvA|nr:Holliday junction branch migration protein RuvA [Candidatus Binataceae bacterium]